MTKVVPGLINNPVPTLREQQEPQAPMDRHDSNYDNDCSIDSWIRGGGSGQATDKPSFDKHRAGR